MTPLATPRPTELLRSHSSAYTVFLMAFLSIPIGVTALIFSSVPRAEFALSGFALGVAGWVPHACGSTHSLSLAQKAASQR